MNTHIKAHSCLLLGYTGFNNIGAEVRIITTIEDIRACFGESASITVASAMPDNTAKILYGHGVRVAPLPFIFPLLKLFWLISRHDVTFLVEGSTFKQNWSCALLYVFLWSAWCARLLGKKCVTYAVDVGELTSFNKFLTRKICNGVDLIITRSENARERLVAMGVRRNILSNTDTAFKFLLATEDAGRASLAGRKTVGVAPIEFHQWPVRVKLFGKKQECFHWPYYFSWDDARREKSNKMIRNYERLVEHCISVHDMDVSLIAMEEVDVPVCAKILETVRPECRSRVSMLYSKDLSPYEMVLKLREVDYLVASRYHACVLSMNGQVPQMSICHDERLEALYDELDFGNDFLLNFEDPQLAEKFIPTFDQLVSRGGELSVVLKRKHDGYFLPKCEQNAMDLQTWMNNAFELPEPTGIPSRLSRDERISNA